MDQNVISPFRLAMVVPCYNESKRINLDYWSYIVRATIGISWFFVDDGSSDSTYELLHKLERNAGIQVLRLRQNLGKAEALRAGFRNAIEQGNDVIGFIDADGSFDREEVIEVCKRFQQKNQWNSPNHDHLAVFMSRNSLSDGVEYLSTLRRISGLLISKINSTIWKELPTDTQCGFKFFRRNKGLYLAMSHPFSNSWFFEIELLMRIRQGSQTHLKIKEVPLRFCQHISGSNTDRTNFLNSAWQVLNVALKLIQFRLFKL